MDQRSPRRPGRKTPSAKNIMLYWASRDEYYDFDLFTPACFRCRRRARYWSDLDRAHLVDRARNGLDLECNIVLLCAPCHRVMPSFGVGEEGSAILWTIPLHSRLAKSIYKTDTL